MVRSTSNLSSSNDNKRSIVMINLINYTIYLPDLNKIKLD